MREIKFRAWDKNRKEMLPVTMMDWRIDFLSVGRLPCKDCKGFGLWF